MCNLVFLLQPSWRVLWCSKSQASLIAYNCNRIWSISIWQQSALLLLPSRLDLGAMRLHLTAVRLFSAASNRPPQTIPRALHSSWVGTVLSIAHWSWTPRPIWQKRPRRLIEPFRLLSCFHVACVLLLGLIILCVLAAVIDWNNVDVLFAAELPMAVIIQRYLGATWSLALMSIFTFIQFFQALSSMYANSRQCFAHPRDNALPFSSVLRKVDKRGPPFAAILCTFAVALLLGLLIMVSHTAAEDLFECLWPLSTWRGQSRFGCTRTTPRQSPRDRFISTGWSAEARVTFLLHSMFWWLWWSPCSLPTWVKTIQTMESEIIEGGMSEGNTYARESCKVLIGEHCFRRWHTYS